MVILTPFEGGILDSARGRCLRVRPRIIVSARRGENRRKPCFPKDRNIADRVANLTSGICGVGSPLLIRSPPDRPGWPCCADRARSRGPLMRVALPVPVTESWLRSRVGVVVADASARF